MELLDELEISITLSLALSTDSEGPFVDMEGARSWTLREVMSLVRPAGSLFTFLNLTRAARGSHSSGGQIKP